MHIYDVPLNVYLKGTNVIKKVNGKNGRWKIKKIFFVEV